MALLAIPSKSAAARVFMVSTVASKPILPEKKRCCNQAKVVTWPGTTSWLTSCSNSGTEISSEALIS